MDERVTKKGMEVLLEIDKYAANAFEIIGFPVPRLRLNAPPYFSG